MMVPYGTVMDCHSPKWGKMGTGMSQIPCGYFTFFYPRWSKMAWLRRESEHVIKCYKAECIGAVHLAKRREKHGFRDCYSLGIFFRSIHGPQQNGWPWRRWTANIHVIGDPVHCRGASCVTWKNMVVGMWRLNGPSKWCLYMFKLV